MTTKHVSPVGAIPPDGEAARWLIAHGADPADLNVFSSRRGNWEVMVRGLFTNPTVRNLLGDAIPAGSTINTPSGDRSEEHTSELQSLMRISYAVFCLKKKIKRRKV